MISPRRVVQGTAPKANDSLVLLFRVDEMVFHFSQKIESDDEDNGEEDDGEHAVLPEKEELKLRVFRNMCREAKLEPLDTVDGCVANLKSVLINIPDYIDAKRTGRPIKIWPPHQFQEFKKYTLSAEHRIDQKTAGAGDGLLAALLQVLKPNHAANIYQSRRDHAVKVREECASRAPGAPIGQTGERWLTPIKEEPSTFRGGECDVRDSGYACDETDYSDPDEDLRDSGCDVVESNSNHPSSPRSIKDETVDAAPWSPSSIGSSVVEILLNTQTETKRDFSDFMEGQNNSEDDEVVFIGARKRARI